MENPLENLPAWVAWCLLAAVLVFWALGAHNRLVRLRGRINTRFAHVHTQLVGRQQLLLQWSEAVAPLLDDRPSAVEAVAAAGEKVMAACERARPKASQARPIGELRLAEDELNAARAAAANALPAQADRLLPSGGLGATVGVLNEELLAADSTLSFARQQFNESVQDYNDAMLQFPTWIVAGLFGFRAAATL